MAVVDELDFRILAVLHQDPLISHRAAAERLGTTATTVGNRIKGLVEVGVLSGFKGLPAARVLGLQQMHWVFRPRDAVELQDVLRADTVAMATVRHDYSASVFSYIGGENSQPEPSRALLDLLGPPDVTGSLTSGRQIVLSSLDWRILRVLCSQPRLPATDVAQMCRLSPKTVRKRRQALVSERHLTVVPLLNAQAAPGITLFELTLKFDAAMSPDRLRVLVNNATLLHHRPDGLGAYFFCWAKSAGEAFEEQRRLERLPNVDIVHLHFPRSRGVASERVKTWIDEARAVWEKTGT